MKLPGRRSIVRLKKKEQEINGQIVKITESEEKGHGKRLEQRQNRLVVMEKDMKECKKKAQKIVGDIEAIGPVVLRSYREFR